MQLQEAGIATKLQNLLGNTPRQCFHATRGLVYMGKLDDVGSCSLFSETAACLEVDSVVLSTDEDDGHSYARYTA